MFHIFEKQNDVENCSKFFDTFFFQKINSDAFETFEVKKNGMRSGSKSCLISLEIYAFLT